MKRLALLTSVLVSLLAPATAPAALGDNYGLADSHNSALDPGLDVDAPAYPAFTPPGWSTPKAFWFGVCDLDDPQTSGTGAGALPAISPIHCIDHGTSYTMANSFNPDPPRETTWLPGKEPAWRLDSLSQAGAHPDVTLSVWFNRYPNSPSTEFGGTHQIASDGDTRNIKVKLPPGFLGNPGALPKCEAEKLDTTPPACPPETQVGIATLTLGEGGVDVDTGANTPPSNQRVPIWNVEPRTGKVAEFMLAANINQFGRVNVPITARARSEGDFGIDTMAIDLPSALPVLAQTITLWGVPFAASHDPYRPPTSYVSEGQEGIPEDGFPDQVGNQPQPYDPSWGPARAFLFNQTECAAVAPSTVLDLQSWHRPGETFSYASQLEAPKDGCAKVPFEPSFDVTPTSSATDSPTVLDVDLQIPQNVEPKDPLGDPLPTPLPGASQVEVEDYVEDATEHWRSDAGIATSALKDTTVTLPEGFTINPAAANGQQACSISQIGLTSGIGATPIRFDNSDPDDGIGDDCPDAAKVGTVAAETPVLDEADWPTGSVYLAKQFDNPFDSLLAIYLVLESPNRGLTVKLAGEIELNQQTGQLSATFRDNPPLPVSRFELHFKPGARAPLATPTTCGSPSDSTSLTPYARPGQPVLAAQPFAVTSGPNGSACPASKEARPFDLGFDAGSTGLLAGAHTPFTLRLTRPDGAQELSSLELTTPEGLAATLAGVPQCSEAQISTALSRTAPGQGAVELSSPSCPPSTQVGTTTVGAGAGPSPFYVGGKAYLSGPYKGAPLSLAVVVPALAGPFDLGVVTVRTALRVNPVTAQITAVSDPFPQMLQGIPLRVRDVRVEIDRPGFTFNPTDCSEQSVTGKAFGSGGAVANLSNRFQVAECARLGFKPSLKLRLKGKTKRSGYPQLTATLTARPGDANIDRASVALPRSEFLAQSHIGTVCTRVQFAAEQCPPRSVYGSATAISPVLDFPLSGPVYLRSSNNPLPDLVAALKGPDQMPIEIELSGRTDSKNEGIRNTFDVVPDAPVSKFTLRLLGGKKGLLENSRDICLKPYRATVKLDAQNGKRLTLRPRLLADCKGKKPRKGGKKGKTAGR